MTNKGKNWRAGQSQNHAVTKNNAIVGRLWSEYDTLGTWKAVGDKYGLTSALVYRVAHGYEPKKSAVRAKLGLPALVLTDVCPVHGIVHKTKRCPPNAKPSKPRRSYKRELIEKCATTAHAEYREAIANGVSEHDAAMLAFRAIREMGDKN